MKLFGLRLSRVPEFWQCVKASSGRPSAFKKLLSGALSVIFNRGLMPPKSIAKWRLKQCLKCPHREGGHFDFHKWVKKGKYVTVYDAVVAPDILKPIHHPLRCAKCGCYIPYLVSSAEEGTPCPARQEHFEKGWV